MNIFSDRTGRAVLVPDVGFPLAVALADWPGAAAMKAVVTSFGMSAAGNFQLMHTLRNFVYVYVFGERVSELTVGGLALAADCDRQEAGSGVERLWEYYQKKKVSAAGLPVSVAVGSRMAFQGFLTGFQFQAADPAYGLAQWGLKFLFHPPEA